MSLVWPKHTLDVVVEWKKLVMFMYYEKPMKSVIKIQQAIKYHEKEGVEHMKTL